MKNRKAKQFLSVGAGVSENGEDVRKSVIRG
jgi:hypothetical protein